MNRKPASNSCCWRKWPWCLSQLPDSRSLRRRARPPSTTIARRRKDSYFQVFDAATWKPVPLAHLNYPSAEIPVWGFQPVAQGRTAVIRNSDEVLLLDADGQIVRTLFKNEEAGR